MIGGFLLQVKPRFGLRRGSGSRQVGVVDFHIIGKGQFAGAADHPMVGLSRSSCWLERAIFRLDGCAAAPNKSTYFIHFLQKRTR